MILYNCAHLGTLKQENQDVKISHGEGWMDTVVRMFAILGKLFMIVNIRMVKPTQEMKQMIMFEC